MKSTQIPQSRITLMRQAFATGCKNLGLSQETCLALTLLLQSEKEIETMVWALSKAEEEGIKLSRTQVMLLAEKKCENGWVICPVCLSCCNDGLFDSLIAKHRRNGYVPPRLLECEGKGHNNKHIYFCPKCATKIEEIYIDEKQQQEDGTDKIVKIKVWGCPKCKISYEKELKKQKEE